MDNKRAESVPLVDDDVGRMLNIAPDCTDSNGPKLMDVAPYFYIIHNQSLTP